MILILINVNYHFVFVVSVNYVGFRDVFNNFTKRSMPGCGHLVEVGACEFDPPGRITNLFP